MFEMIEAHDTPTRTLDSSANIFGCLGLLRSDFGKRFGKAMTAN
jgi:hypothetical protein